MSKATNLTLPRLRARAESLGAQCIGDPACLEFLAPDGFHWAANTASSFWFTPQFTAWQPGERTMALRSVAADLDAGLEACSPDICQHLEEAE